MTIKIGINGFGRIGRCVARAIFEHKYDDIELVAINGPAIIDTHLHLLKYDSVHGKFGDVKKTSENSFIIEHGGRKSADIKVSYERQPDKIDWSISGADIILECSGKFNNAEDAALHYKSGDRKVIISAPVKISKNPIKTIIYGVNHNDVTMDDDIISIGSCTTNCLAPIAKILHENFIITAGFMTSIHSYTGDQNLVDSSHRDLYRARAAASSMVPTSTGAAKTIGVVLPELEGKLNGCAIRVPTNNVSLLDLSFTSEKNLTVAAIEKLMLDAASNEMSGVVSCNNEKLVSTDFNHNSHSAIIDLPNIYTQNNNFARISAWYDNEWGFSCRMLDMVGYMAKFI